MKRSMYALLCLPVLPVLPACNGGGEPSRGGSYSAPAPRHPAMQDPAPATASAPRKDPHDHGSGLPPDHPPIESAPEPAPGAAPAAAPAGGGLSAKLAGLGLDIKIPEGWVEAPSSGPMRLGTIRLPRVEGDTEDGELSVIPAMGTVEANVDRWSGQFKEKPEPTVASRTVSGIEVTTVEMEGTFDAGSGGPMMKTAGGPRPGTKLLGAIIKVPGNESLIFFKAWGPKKTMEKWKPSFESLVASIRPR